MTAQGESHSQFCFMLSVFLVLEGRVTNHVVLEIQKKVYEITYGGGGSRKRFIFHLLRILMWEIKKQSTSKQLLLFT